MVIHHEYEQRSAAWWAIKLGRITGSRFDDIMKRGRGGKEWGEVSLAVLRDIAAEALTGEQEETFQSKAMEWGIENESAAMAHYMELTGEDIRECGFFENTDIPGCGSSPDAIGNDLTVEFKCPASKTHLLYLLDADELIKKYRWQVVGEALFTDSKRAVIASYDPRFPMDKRMAVYEYPSEELAKDKELLKLRLISAVDLVQGWIK